MRELRMPRGPSQQLLWTSVALSAAFSCALAWAYARTAPSAPLRDAHPDLPTDWVHEHVNTYDSFAGRWTSAARGIVIEYDVGDHAGHYADASRPERYPWFDTRAHRGLWYNLAVCARADAPHLYLTFSHPRGRHLRTSRGGPVNLFTRLSAQAVDEREIEALLPLLLERSHQLLNH